MSGFEIAGIVLGAFPLVITALEKYREVATRLGLFYKIKLEYRKCSNELEFHQLTLTRHLKQLLLPLVVDDDKIKELVEKPGGEAWKDSSIEQLLQQRLKDSYGLYLDCIQNMEQVMHDLNHELALDSQPIQGKLYDTLKPPSSLARVKSALTPDGRLFQLYKVKFSNGESVRNKLFAELQASNDKLEKLLDSSDKESHLLQQRALAKQSSAVDTAICNFWIQGAKLFKALSASWKCHCNGQHSVKLLLQHPTTKTLELELLSMKSLNNNWEIKKTRISQGNDLVSASNLIKEASVLAEKLPLRQPSHRLNKPIKSSMKTRSPNATAQLPRVLPSITLTTTSHDTLLPNALQPITNLCGALDESDSSCYGYLPIADEDCRYYVYSISSQQRDSIPSIYLDQIVRGDILPPPTRRQRYSLALVLASSFLQMMDTPWLTSSFKREEIAFFSDPATPKVFLLDKPHMPSFPRRSPANSNATSLSQSLDQLGILLLELCYGKRLADQPFRKAWPSGGSEVEEMVFDVMAARDWQCGVNEEAGPDYSEAVAWCLGGNRSAPTELWRQDMLKKVVRPLQCCREYLVGSSTI
ncbi:hypothetical protein GQ53DRAFT_707647 [Thozetella sp. PMI_491]|nr:hypothetical protein GQ53DRAFT_707647 [Thozetella sp. PMI_491]